GFLHIWTPVGFLSLDETHYTDDLKAEIPGGFNGLDRGRAGRADIIHDDDASTLLAEALDALSGSVLLLRLAHQESIQFAAHHGDCHHDRVGAHREAADRLCFPTALSDFFQENLSGQARAFGIERSRAAIDVIVAGPPGGELEFPESERFVRQDRKQLLPRRL